MVLRYYVHRLVTFEITQKTHDEVWSLGSYFAV